MNKYFSKYLEAKESLCKMVGQFFNSYLSCSDANELKIKYNKEDLSFSNFVEVCFHEYESDGLLAWKYLNIKKDYITHKELWDLEDKIKYEEYKDSFDYHKEYLKICILLIDLTKKYYNISLSHKEINKNYTLYDEELDTIDDAVIVCNHLYESAGESIWDLFELSYPMVGISYFDKKRDCCVKELSENKRRKLVKNTRKQDVK